jgi:glycosyltransferase involved in cell wall biosynthesis
MKKPKVLVDLALAHYRAGFSGIPQDTRLLFDGLEQSQALEATGLLWSTAGSWTEGGLKSLAQQSVFLSFHLRHPRSSFTVARIAQFSPRLAKIWERMFADREKTYDLFDLAHPVLKEIVWRTHFSATLKPQRRQEVLEASFLLSALSFRRLQDAAYGIRARPFLNTAAFDIAIFQDSRAVICAPNTQKVIRYHDGIPVLGADTMPEEWWSRLHSKAVKACEDDSIYVCNSTSAKRDLEIISPRAAERAEVIPYFVPHMAKISVPRNLEDIAATRISESTLGKKRPSDIVKAWFGAEGETPRYIMTLSTIEPRKNHRGLIRAWQQLRGKTKEDIKLLIVGKPGWNYEPILKDMQPFVEQGTILHLEGVNQQDLSTLYSVATCFAFVSFSEGFGLPPVEAQQCDCPVVVSDIPAHRYASGEGALYCDPYDDDDIAEKLEQVLIARNDGSINSLIERGRKNAERFTIKTVLPLWEDFCERHSRRGERTRA